MKLITFCVNENEIKTTLIEYNWFSYEKRNLDKIF